jgi:ATP synthase F1 delta subunit
MKIARQEIIKRYTRAFLEVYKERLEPRDLHVLSSFASFLKHHHLLAFFAHHAVIDHEKQVALYLKAVLYKAPDARAELIDALEKLITILADHERLAFLPDIMALLVVRFFTSIGYQHATVTTAIALTAEQKKEIIESFKALTGKKVDAEFKIDYHLIAGMRIVSQDYLWESSLAQKIKALG